jgi:ribosomal RNA assembly protein
MEKRTLIKIPRQRIGALIGPDGRDKRLLERIFKVDMIIDSRTGNVEAILKPEQGDISVIFTLRNVVRAIGRGFSPRRALSLVEEGYDLIIIDLEDYVGTSRNAQNRVKGRVIGREGKARRMIEDMTGCFVSVYGSTISLIGPFEHLHAAREGVLMLVKGAFHKTVWNYLYAYRREVRRERALIWYEGGKGE